MAMVQSEKSVKVTLNVETATDTFKNRIFNNVNPAIVDDKIGEIFGTATTSTGTMAALQSKAVNRLQVTRVYTLTEE